MTPRPTPYIASFSFVIMTMAGLVFSAAALASFYYFSGFWGGGRSWIAIVQAFFVCFGLGAMFYLPAAILFLMARNVRRARPDKSIGMAAFALSLPLCIYGIFGLVLKLPFPYLTGFILIYGLLVLGWGVLVFILAGREAT